MICHDSLRIRERTGMWRKAGKNSGVARDLSAVPCDELISSIVRHVLNEKSERYMRARRGYCTTRYCTAATCLA